MWTAEGFLSIKDGTDEALYVHPFNTVFNLEHPVAFIAENLSEIRPNITGYRTFTLSDITEKYLKRSLTSAETIIGRGIGSFYVVMPGGNDFSDNRWHVVNNASPTAAVRTVRQSHKSIAAAYEFDIAMEDDERTVLVYRLGSSTLEVSVFLAEEGVYDKLSSIYDQHLGGNDFNKRLVKYLLLAHKKKTLQDLSTDHKFIMRLEREVEKAKQALSYQNSVRIEIQSFHPGGQDFFQELTRPRFVDLNMDLFTKSIAAVDQAIRDANLTSKDDIQDIVLSGGSSNIPFLQSTIKDYFGEKKKYHGLTRPETAAVFGAVKLAQQAQLPDTRTLREMGLCCFCDDEDGDP
ncbi:ATPase with role in protein import into the ER [Podila clonocystis]|nr:ATPase with role in protein import into the ER [Podila clonocystis]